MTYFSVEDFVGNGALKGILPKLLEEGWDDVRNLKLMKSEDMDAINMTQQQKDALEMRSYLHDRALMQYGDKLEDSGKSLAKLLELSNDDLSAQFGMKRGHTASFLEKSITCHLQAPYSLPSTKKTNTPPRYNYIINSASEMDPNLYREAMGDKEKMEGEKKPELVPHISWSSRLCAWINWFSESDTKLSEEKIGGKENEDNDEDVHYLMQYINDQQQLELQFTSNKNTVLHVAAQFGNKKYVKIILEKSPLSSLLCCLNIDGETPLHIAVREGHLDIVKALVGHAKRLDHEEVESGGGAAMEMLRATNKDNDTVLHMAVRNPDNVDVVEWLAKEDPEFTHPPNNAKETPLYLAAERQHNDMVSMILKNCRSPTYGGPKGQTALHAATTDRLKIESTKLLLEWKSDLIKETDEYGWTPLHYAARFGNQYGVKLMLEKDKSVAYITTDKEGYEKTALHIAAAHGHKDIEGNTSLHLLATFLEVGKRDIWRELWFSGDRLATNNENVTPINTLLSRTKEHNPIGGARNIVSRDQELTTKIRKEERKKREAQVKEEGKAWNKELKEMADTHIIVAILITTITFAASCTMPGGFNSNKGSNQGMPLLLGEVAFKVFVITNTIAMICSISSVFLYVTASVFYFNEKDNVETLEKRYMVASSLVVVAVAALIVAFITGSYAVLAHSLALAIFVCVVGCISFFIYFFELKKLQCEKHTISFIKECLEGMVENVKGYGE
ncbi:ankyrin repeat-containing protein ITN1-like isoform X2 [Camellia sinensis]|uniref:ankyrin repeat-containing protein ITN1-like isoform X2 n=1 Tax=Camellia sinensis TaxID=4442 RepID=UPI00103566FC|nr:ankyrin repeat-containing protein ITN1-like isoform X2 [Camellia sinensis]